MTVEEKKEGKNKESPPELTEEDQKILGVIKSKDDEITRLKSRITLLESLKPLNEKKEEPPKRKSLGEVEAEIATLQFERLMEIWGKE